MSDIPQLAGAFCAEDVYWMSHAMQLARLGMYSTHPNPRVGCVIVKEGRKVGEGAHLYAGGDHAEVVALRQAGDDAAGATAYVTLEPCAHMGRTPPCTQALIRSGIGRVVAAMRDPFDAVDGKGFDRLRDAGIEVKSGLLQDEAEELNVGFLCRVRTGRPWVRLKLAISLDGKVAMASGESKWITGSAARQDVHTYRAQSDVVLTGIGTVLSDDPSLTARNVPGLRSQPTRVVLDRQGRTPAKAKVLDKSAPTLVFRNSGEGVNGAINILAPLDADSSLDLDFVLKELGDRCFNEVLVECGGTISSSFLRHGLVDELLVYQAPCLLGDLAQPMTRLHMDLLEQRMRFRLLEAVAIDNDLRIRMRPMQLKETDKAQSQAAR